MTDYFDMYRQKITEITDLKTEMKKIYEETESTLDRLRSKINKAEQEVVNMRRVISKMIDNNIDDIEARLRLNENDTPSLWSEQHSISMGENTNFNSLKNSKIASLANSQNLIIDWPGYNGVTYAGIDTLTSNITNTGMIKNKN